MNAPIRIHPQGLIIEREERKKKLGFTVRSSQIVFNEGKRKKKKKTEIRAASMDANVCTASSPEKGRGSLLP